MAPDKYQMIYTLLIGFIYYICPMETWKPVIGFEKYYHVSSLGNVKSLDRISPHPISKSGFRFIRGRLLKPYRHPQGYLYVMFQVENVATTKKVHRLVAESFIKNLKNKPQVNHKNGIKTDNRKMNLEWVTASENQKHAYKFLGVVHYCKGKFGSEHHRSKKVIQMDMNGNKINEFSGLSEASRITGIERTNIGAVCSMRIRRGKYLVKQAGGFKWKFA